MPTTSLTAESESKSTAAAGSKVGGGQDENGNRLCEFEAPDDNGNRPVFAPETGEQSVSKRGEDDKRALYSFRFLAERSLHTGEVVGSIPAAPTIFQALTGSFRQ
jgi:hypothetical protein